MYSLYHVKNSQSQKLSGHCMSVGTVLNIQMPKCLMPTYIKQSEIERERGKLQSLWAACRGRSVCVCVCVCVCVFPRWVAGCQVTRQNHGGICAKRDTVLLR